MVGNRVTKPARMVEPAKKIEPTYSARPARPWLHYSGSDLRSEAHQSLYKPRQSPTLKTGASSNFDSSRVCCSHQCRCEGGPLPFYFLAGASSLSFKGPLDGLMWQCSFALDVSGFK
ncbi:hypothetical protein F2Q68_00038550 [Brassica cretica]|uniref:Uncharacterized protein n=1 Tax=Brassica cretica TaxID=69181 RepID=A0A8S9MP07_BRACR|nr:hypothetical protein F2Q68_00038550 [Brassica cretica]